MSRKIKGVNTYIRKIDIIAIGGGIIITLILVSLGLI